MCWEMCGPDMEDPEDVESYLEWVDQGFHWEDDD